MRARGCVRHCDRSTNGHVSLVGGRARHRSGHDSPYVIAAIGERMARRYMVTGEEFDAAEAYRIGFIHDIVEDAELNAAWVRCSRHLYSSGPKAIAAVKDLIAMAAHAPIDENVIEETSRRIADIRATRKHRKVSPHFSRSARPHGLHRRSRNANSRAKDASELSDECSNPRKDRRSGTARWPAELAPSRSPRRLSSRLINRLGEAGLPVIRRRFFRCLAEMGSADGRQRARHERPARKRRFRISGCSSQIRRGLYSAIAAWR